MSSNNRVSVAEEISNTAESLEEQQARIEEFQDFIQDAEEQLEDLDQNKRRAFYEKAEDLRLQIDQVNNVEELLELQNDIEETIRSPLQEATIDAFEEFIEIVGIDFSSETEAEIRENIKDSIQSDLDTMTETFGNLSQQVEDLPNHLRDLIAKEIEGHPSYLTSDHSQLTSKIEKLEDRHQSLQSLQDILNRVGSWTPDKQLTGANYFYDDLDTSIYPDDIEEYIEKIDSNLSELSESGLNISELVKQDLEENLDAIDIEDLDHTFADISRSVATLQRRYEKVNGYANDIEDFGRNRGVFESKIDDLVASQENLEIQTYGTLQGLKEEVGGLKEDFETFFDKVAERLRAQQEMVNDLRAEFDSTEPPSVDEPFAGESPINNLTISEDPTAALEASKNYDVWIESAFEELEGSFETEEAIIVWKQLYKGESVTITEENKEAVLALAERFTINVVLGSG